MDNSFEKIFLRKFTHNTEFFNKTFPIVKAKYFSDIGNQELFKLITEYYKNYKECPPLTALVASVKNVPNAEIRAEIVKSLQEISKTEEVSNLQFMCDETVSWVKDALYFESLQVGSDGLMKKDDQLKLKAQRLMDERAKITIDSDLGLDFDDIDSMIEYYSERLTGIRTQHPELNKRLGPGFLPGTLSLFLAPPGVGKSLMMTDLISGMIKQGKNILLVSLEMADKEIMKRVHANAMDLPINSLIDLSKTPGELENLGRPIIDKEKVLAAYNKMKTSGNCGKFFVKDYPACSLSPLMLEQLVESYKLEKGINFDIVFVDYIGIMKSDLITPNAGLYSYIKSIAEETRAVAKKLALPIVSASQLNRGATNEVNDVDNSNVSDSMGSAMTADLMVFLLQNEEMKKNGEMVCKITKNRLTGRTDSWMMNVDYEHMRFSDMAVQNAGNIDIEITNILTPTKQAFAEDFANSEIKAIQREDIEKLKKDPFTDNIEDIYKELGI